MKNIIFLILGFLLSIIILSCEKYQIVDEQPDIQNKIDTILLLKKDTYVSFEKYVVLYDQDDYLIKSPLYLFMQDLFYVSGIPDYAKYLTIADSIIHDAYEYDELLMSKYFDTRRQNYVLAYYLGEGSCYVFDKGNNVPVAELIKETWGYYCGPLCGAGGRKFYIQGKLFLDVLDWISKK